MCHLIFCIISVLSISFGALCKETTNVAVAAQNGELRVRAGAELADLGYSPVTVEAGETVLTAETCLALLGKSESAALLEVLAGEGVRVWVFASDSGTAQMVESVPFAPGERTDASVLVQAVELVRARLMKIEEEKEAPEPPVAPVAPAAEPVDSIYRVTVSAAPALTYGFSELPPTLQVLLGLQIRLVGWLHIDVLGLVPTFPMTHKNSAGSVKARNGAATIGLRMALRNPALKVVPWVGVLGGVQFLSVAGKGIAPFGDGDDFVAGGVLYGRGGVDVRLTKRVVLFAAVRLGPGMPRQVVQMGEQIPFGNPLFGGSLGIRVGFF